MMRYMNRRKNTLGILPLLATVLLSAASCTESVVQDMETAGDSGAIRFSLPTLTRSAIGSADDLNTDGQSFSVWGSYRHTSGTDNDVQIFDNTTVTYGSGTGWTYGGGLLYWQSGNTYDFYASIRPPERWAMPCPSPARTAPLPSRTSSPRKGTT